jgi:hypothetical protein
MVETKQKWLEETADRGRGRESLSVEEETVTAKKIPLIELSPGPVALTGACGKHY